MSGNKSKLHINSSKNTTKSKNVTTIDEFDIDADDILASVMGSMNDTASTSTSTSASKVDTNTMSMSKTRPSNISKSSILQASSAELDALTDKMFKEESVTTTATTTTAAATTKTTTTAILTNQTSNPPPTPVPFANVTTSTTSDTDKITSFADHTPSTITSSSIYKKTAPISSADIKKTTLTDTSMTDNDTINTNSGINVENTPDDKHIEDKNEDMDDNDNDDDSNDNEDMIDVSTSTSKSYSSSDKNVVDEKKNEFKMYLYDIVEEYTKQDSLFLFGKSLKHSVLQSCQEKALLKAQQAGTIDQDSSTTAATNSEIYAFSNIEEDEVDTVSTCVVVQNIFRSMFVLPRKYHLSNPLDPTSVTDKLVTLDDVTSEIRQILSDRGHSSIQTRTIEKEYCFDRRPPKMPKQANQANKAVTHLTDSDSSSKQTLPKEKTKRKRKTNNGDGNDGDNADDDDDDEDTTSAILQLGEDDEIPPERASLLDPYNIVPRKTTYVNVRYPFREPELPADIVGCTFSAIFNTRATKTETFILDREISGPSWITVKGAKKADINTVSWTSLEFTLDKPFYIQKYIPGPTFPEIAPPTLDVASIIVQTGDLVSSKSKNTTTTTTTTSIGVGIMAITIKFQPRFSLENSSQKTLNTSHTHGNQRMKIETYTFIRPPEGQLFPLGFKEKTCKSSRKSNELGEIITCTDEKNLISEFVHKIHALDPDVLLSHDLHGWILDILTQVSRRHTLGVLFSKIGRLRRSMIPSTFGSGNVSLADMGVGSGRLLLDTQTSAREFWSGEKNYSFTALTLQKCNITRIDIEPHAVGSYYNTIESITNLIKRGTIDAMLQLELMIKQEALPLTRQLTELCGNLWQRSLRSARAERIEYLLLRTFVQKGFIPPEKLSKKERERREQEDADTILDGDFEAAYGEGVAKSTANSTASRKRRKAEYAGGTVLDPIRGFYDTWVVVLDFNSLYPSIIREYKICFSTLQHWKQQATTADNYTTDMTAQYIDGAPTPSLTLSSTTEMSDSQNSDSSTTISTFGILPGVVADLIERRKAVKSMLKLCKDASESAVLDIRQKALKLVANAMYGCLGFRSSRFYCQPLAALITYRGRQALDTAVKTATKSGAQIIYGDTDSIMVNTQTTELYRARMIAQVVKRDINRQYNVLRIDEDAYLHTMLLLNKKRYAALKHIKDMPIPTTENGMEKIRQEYRSSQLIVEKKSTQQQQQQQQHENTNMANNMNGTLLIVQKEVKGLDQVRRDWAPISRSTSDTILDILLSGLPRDDVIASIKEHLIDLASRMDQKRLLLSDYTMTKQITRPPSDYTNAKDLPHVQVALKLIASNISVRANDIIEYIITKGDGPIATRAVPVSRLLEQQESNYNGEILEIDILYYKELQILPPLVRLIAVIEDITAAELADCLGLDSKVYAKRHIQNSTNFAQNAYGIDITTAPMDDFERYKDMEPIPLRCVGCGVKFPFIGLHVYKPYRIQLHTLPKIAMNVSDVSVGATVGTSIPSTSTSTSTSTSSASTASLNGVMSHTPNIIPEGDESIEVESKESSSISTTTTTNNTMPTAANNNGKMIPLITPDGFDTDSNSTTQSQSSIIPANVPSAAFQSYAHALSYIINNPTIQLKSTIRESCSGFFCPTPNCKGLRNEREIAEMYNIDLSLNTPHSATSLARARQRHQKEAYITQLKNYIDKKAHDITHEYYEYDQIFAVSGSMVYGDGIQKQAHIQSVQSVQSHHNNTNSSSLISRDVQLEGQLPIDKLLSSKSVYEIFCYFAYLVNQEKIEQMLEEENKLRTSQKKEKDALQVVDDVVSGGVSGVRGVNTGIKNYISGVLPKVDDMNVKDIGKHIYKHTTQWLLHHDYHMVDLAQLFSPFLK